MGKYRVILWGPGNVGKQSLRQIIQHPELELVGVRVNSESKVGLDAGELAGLAANGILATRDTEALLALNADAVCYHASEIGRDTEVIDELCQILRSGTNVVTAMCQMTYPESLGPEFLSRLQEAAAAGGSSVYGSGGNPGYFADALVLNLSSATNHITSLVATEFFDMSTYYEPLFWAAVGFGNAPEDDAPALEMLMAWRGGPPLKLMARAFGIEIDEFVPFRRVALAPKPVDLEGLHVAKGTIAAVHHGIRAMVGGEARMTIDDYHWISEDAYPDEWDQPPEPGRGGYRISITGEPCLRADVAYNSPGTDALTDVLWSTGSRCVNAIPRVCEAEPGVLTALDVGAYYGDIVGSGTTFY